MMMMMMIQLIYLYHAVHKLTEVDRSTPALRGGSAGGLNESLFLFTYIINISSSNTLTIY